MAQEAADVEIAALQADLAAAVQLAETVISERDALAANADATAQERAAEIARLEALVASQAEEARATIDDLSTRLAAARAAADASEEERAAEIARLEGALSRQAAASEASLSELRARLAAAMAAADASASESDTARQTITSLQTDLAAARAAAQAAAEDSDAALAALRAEVARQEAAAADLTADREELRRRLAAAVAARLAAETQVEEQGSDAAQRAALLAAARDALSEEQEISAEAQRKTELLNQQVAALRTQLGELQSLLDDARVRDAAKDIQLQSLGTELNTALARVAAEERRRAELEAAERARLEEEARALEEARRKAEAQAQDLELYRSEFFGRLRDVLGRQEGVRIEGDRFVFSSEVLFPPGGAVLSFEGQQEVAKVAAILRSVASDIPPELNWVIRVDGHTDDTPLLPGAEFADNWELSQARALSVVKYMIAALGIPPDRLAANGFGEFQPVAEGDSPEARAQNRRIELKFTEK